MPVAAHEVQLPSAFAGSWETVGRAVVSTTDNTVTVGGGSVWNPASLGDYEMSFRARMPADAQQVQIWAAIRVKDRDDRYVVGLRGGLEPEVSFARYAPDARARFLGFAPLDFSPKPGQWYTVKVAVMGKRFHVYLNDNTLPRINVEDKDAFWNSGGVSLGGGWLATEFADLHVTPLDGNARQAFEAVGTQTWAPPAVDKDAVRRANRAAYTPVKITDLPAGRVDFSLNGQWLFMPDQDLPAGAPPVGADVSDESWHTLAVPSFWTPFLGWLHGESGGLAGMEGLSASRGPSDELVMEEQARVEAQTFDWRHTKSGWYREYLDLPDNVSGRDVHLVFDAIAKVSDIYCNGAHVGSNIGMFGQVDVDLTGSIKHGRNVIAVHVVGQPASRVRDANKVEATAVSVAVTNEMIQSLAHGMAPADSSGIWQPVTLRVTDKVHVGDVFIRPRLDGTSADVELINDEAEPKDIDVSYAIHDCNDHSQLDAAAAPKHLTVPAHGRVHWTLNTPALAPKLWTPWTPNLYMLDITLSENGKAIDDSPTRFGFRTFEVHGSQFLLNGKPFWLRGADHFPATLRPNDAALAKRFIDLARAGNVTVTRTHAVPFTQAWLDAADEEGMGVSFEGTWPWLMIKGDPPAPDLISAWHNEFANLLHLNRNHPSILIWTVNNEMNFANFDRNDIPLLTKKWAILSDMIRDMRRIDPTRPISAYSGYRRHDTQVSYNQVVLPHHFDDGDIDDAHSYYGWYNPTFFHLFDGQYGDGNSVPNRPLISQEMATGYPRNDGWPSRSYEFDRYVPEALAGDYSYEQTDPSIFLTRQAFMTKELGEVIRRTNRDTAAGVLHFAYLTWFTDVWKADQVRPAPTYYALAKALQPVLVSDELFGRHFYAGEQSTHHVSIINDSIDQQEIPAGSLKWEVRAGEQSLASGTVSTAAVAYYSNRVVDVPVRWPDSLPAPRVDAKLIFTLTAGGRTYSVNDYDIVLATRDWTAVAPQAGLYALDPGGGARDALAGLHTTSVDSLDRVSGGGVLIVGELQAVMNGGGGERLKRFVESGGRLLLLQPGASLNSLFPNEIKGFRAVHGEIVTMQRAESPVFDGIEPLDTAWFEIGGRALPYACSGTWTVNRASPSLTALAMQCDIHVDMNGNDAYRKIGGAPLVEIRLGKGVVLASEMMLSAKDRDPIAGRLLSNMIRYLRAYQPR